MAQGDPRSGRRLGKTIMLVGAILILISAVMGAALLIPGWTNSNQDAGTGEGGGIRDEEEEGGSPNSEEPPVSPPTSRGPEQPPVEPRPPPKEFKARGRDRSIAVSWEAIPGSTGYVIRLTLAGVFSREIRVGDTTSRVIKGLANGRSYQVAVAGVYSDEVGGYSEPKFAVPRAKPTAAPRPQPTSGNSGGSSTGNSGSGGGEVDVVPEPDVVDIEPVP